MTPDTQITSSLWQKALGQIRSELSEQSFSSWFMSTQCLEITSEKIILGVRDKFSSDWLRDHYQDLIISAAAQVLGEGQRPVLEIKICEGENLEAEPLVPSVPGESVITGALRSKPSPQVHLTGLNSAYIFSNFVVGSGNRFAQAAASAVSEAPAKRYNPLFIYGSVGLGKTHLMQAIAHELIEKDPSAKALYTSSEKFVNQLVQSIQNRTQIAFRNRYRNLDILLIDDIHFIAGKEATQEECFHTFNTLHDHHKQIVVSSDRPPKDIPGLEERLVSRFQWGLVVDVQPPDAETRLAILRKKVSRENSQVPDDVLDFIAEKIKSNIRELEGALLRVLAYSSLTNTPITLPVAQHILKESLAEETKKITIDLIQRKTAEYFDISLSDMRVKRRSKTIAFPRQVAMYLVRDLTDHSLPEIGQYFGGRDHTTVLHAYNKITKELSKDLNLIEAVKRIRDSIKN